MILKNNLFTDYSHRNKTLFTFKGSDIDDSTRYYVIYQIVPARWVNLLKYLIFYPPYGISLGLSEDHPGPPIMLAFSARDLSLFPQLSTLNYENSIKYTNFFWFFSRILASLSAIPQEHRKRGYHSVIPISYPKLLT